MFKDVYVTDHEEVKPKYITQSEAEDEDFYDYQKSLDEYNSNTKVGFKPESYTSRYAKGSFMQRVMDPLAGAYKDTDGVLRYHLEDVELPVMQDEDRLRAIYEKMKGHQEVSDVDDEDEDAVRIAMYQELEEGQTTFSIEDFHAVLDKEFNLFGKGEKYDYVKDMKDAYKDSLKQT